MLDRSFARDQSQIAFRVIITISSGILRRLKWNTRESSRPRSIRHSWREWNHREAALWGVKSELLRRRSIMEALSAQQTEILCGPLDGAMKLLVQSQMKVTLIQRLNYLAIDAFCNSRRFVEAFWHRTWFHLQKRKQFRAKSKRRDEEKLENSNKAKENCKLRASATRTIKSEVLVNNARRGSST